MNASLEFFDLQVNGYGGVDFNSDDLQLEGLHTACTEMRSAGVTRCLPTIITADIEQMAARLARLVKFRDQLPEFHSLLVGWHVEGPFINPAPGYVGAHPAAAVRPASIELAAQLLEAGGGLVRLVTLAPEGDPVLATTRWLTNQGVMVSAGHCNPSIELLKRAIDNGLGMFTHLGNGCPLELPRHDNIIQRVLSLREELWICFIADGAHVPYTALSNYLALIGPARAIVTSDSIAAAGKGPGEYTLGSRQVVVDNQLATWSADRKNLVGSATPLYQARQNLIRHVGLSPEVATRLVSHNPKQALGI